MLELPYSTLETLMDNHPQLESIFMKFQKKILDAGQAFPLDYIMNLPKEL